jgi:aconitate hydratase
LLALLLPADPSDYDTIDPTDRISILGLKEFVPGKGLTLQGKRKDGSTYTIPVNHTFNENQVGGLMRAFGENFESAVQR